MTTMLSLRICSSFKSATSTCSLSRPIRRHLHTDYEAKYLDKLLCRAQEQGKSLSELRQQTKNQERNKLRQPLETKATTKPSHTDSEVRRATGTSVRKDSSPVKPLSTLLNLDRIFEKSHTADQISSLWTAYHASRSQGTGRGFICATIPVDIYNKMSHRGLKYPAFVVPLPRSAVQDESGESKKAHEFHFLQWAFHDVPPIPTATSFLFPVPPPIAPESTRPNPPTSTVLFTPLQEYKLRSTFATPYLVLTNYTDLVSTHGIVLLRGEITPSATSDKQNVSGSDYMLSQEDAQLLTMQLQQFYLWNGEEGQDSGQSKERQQLLRLFHEKPEEFKWEELLKHAESL